LGAAITGIGTEPRERDYLQPAEFLGGRLDEQPDFPMAGVIAERDRFAVRGAQPALGAEDKELFAAKLGWVPTHSRVLGESENIAAGAV
jgi:hypothetical protein